MNCLEFRRQLLGEPASKSSELAAHRLQCPACSQFANKVQAFEVCIKEAAHLQVPESLAPRILLQQRMAQRRQSFWRRGMWAMAATIVLTVGLTLRVFLTPVLGLEASVIAHVENELKHLHAHDNVSLAEVNQQMQKYGVQLTQAVATVNFANPCPMRKARGFHLVFQGESGPVTVLIMPKDYIDSRLTTADPHFQAVILPTKNGSMAIVAENATDLAQMETRLASALQFQS
jgi:hypothetical protein